MSFTVLGALRELDEDRHRAELYRAWQLGASAGLTPRQSLEQLGRINFPRTDEMRRYLLVGLQQERTVGPLTKARPNLFGPFECALLSSGDEAHALPAALRLLGDFFASENRRALRIRAILGYPVFLGILGAFTLTLPFLKRDGAPAYVKAIVASVGAFLLLGGIPIAIIGGIIGRRSVFALPRFARSLAIATEAGVPLGRAVRLAVDASGSARLKEHIAKRSERQLGLVPLSALFEGCGAVPAELLGQMRVADATGEYASILKRYADGLENPA